MASIATYAIGTESIGSTLVQSDPIVEITEPGSTVPAALVTAKWSYTSLLGRPQESYRAILRTGLSGQVLEDSGVVAGAATEHAFTFLLQGNSQYQIEIQASDGISIGTASVSFSAEQAGVGVFPDEERVGSVYEVAINGVGFMLADRPEGENRYARRSVTLEPERFATGDTPFSQAIERYTMLGHNDWTGGAGQLLRSRPSSVSTRYWDSERVNPFEPGQLTLVNEVERDLVSSYSNQLAVTVGGTVYVATGNNQLTAISTPLGAETAFTVHANATVVRSLASDGKYWYWTDGGNIYRNSSAASASSAWSTVDVTEIAWCSDRLVGLDTAAINPNVTTFSPNGAEEVDGGRFLFPDAELKGLAAGDGYVWWGVNRGRGGQVYSWQLGNDDAGAAIALSLPHGESVQSLFFYLGNVFLATRQKEVDHDGTNIYRCVPSEGKLTPELVVHLHTDNVTPFWAGHDRFVAFTWKGMQADGSTGIAVIDLSTGGYAKWFTSNTTGTPGGLVHWGGNWAFTVNGEGLYAVTDPDKYVDNGWLITSSDDLESPVSKVFDRMRVTSKSLVGRIDIEWSSDTLESWNAVGTFQGDGSTTAVFDLNLQVAKIGFRFTLHSSTAGTPTLEALMVQLHPLSFADQLIILPLLCTDRATGLNGQELDGSRPGRGDELVRWVESLVPSRVKLQDVDWPTTRTAIAAEAVAVDVETVGVFERQSNRRANSHVATLTLRRRL